MYCKGYITINSLIIHMLHMPSVLLIFVVIVQHRRLSCDLAGWCSSRKRFV